MTRFSRTLLIALAVILGLTLTGCSKVTGGETKEITAYFQDSAGLFVGNEVGVLGVAVGKITAIEPDGKQVKVTLEVDADRKLPENVGAAVVARSVATDRYVELTPVYDSGPELKSGATIPLERTVTPVDFDQVLEALNTFSTGIAGNKATINAVKRFINSADGAVAGKGKLFNETIMQLSQAVTGISGQRKDASATLVSLDTLVATIAQNEQVARTFINQVTEASDLLDDEKGNLRTALRALSSAITTVSNFAQDNRDLIVDGLNQGSRLSRILLSKRNELTELLEVFPLALQNLERTLTSQNTIPVRIPPSVLLPLGEQILDLCNLVNNPLCDVLGTSTPRPQTNQGAAR